MKLGEVFFEPADSSVEMGIQEGCESNRLILFLCGSLIPSFVRRLELTLIRSEEPEKIQHFFNEFKPLLQDEKQLPQTNTVLKPY